MVILYIDLHYIDFHLYFTEILFIYLFGCQPCDVSLFVITDRAGCIQIMTCFEGGHTLEDVGHKVAIECHQPRQMKRLWGKNGSQSAVQKSGPPLGAKTEKLGPTTNNNPPIS
jgi:hypothetical protein